MALRTCGAIADPSTLALSLSEARRLSPYSGPQRPKKLQSRFYATARVPIRCAKDLFEEEDERSSRRWRPRNAWQPGEELGMFLRETVDRTTLLPLEEAIRVLSRYDAMHLEAVRTGRSFSMLNLVGECGREPLQRAVISVAARSGTILLGICGPDSARSVECLKAYTAALALPRGLLKGLDQDGVPIEISTPCFVKYNSVSGDAFVSPYTGNYEGVLLTPTVLNCTDFFQYGYLPLTLFSDLAAA